MNDAVQGLAVVGVACRFAGGVASAEQLWDVVAGGVDVVGEFPGDRGWDVTEGGFARRGGFLDDVAGFDAGFFGISPREAAGMDPQQRVLLEVCWEALEDAGIVAAGLRGSQAGVFVGASSSGYESGLTGTSGGVLSGRVSYVLGLGGPAVTVDTATSSSLVAVHLAGQSLRSGECDLALAGGVAVLASPALFAEFARLGGLSGDGVCRPFAEAAAGTVWGEGAGVLVLERLSDARRNGHRVLAVISGSAVNQDGASAGLTVPDGAAQQRVIRSALASARLSPDQVDVVEAHGTGTRVGDPVEAGALLATYGQGRPADRPLLLGSVKSNIGHAQAAAGVAGLIKMVAAVDHGVVPATLHVGAPSSRVDWGSGAVRLVTEPVPWPVTGEPRRAGVSSFGLGGTNAHVIVEQAPPGSGDDLPGGGAGLFGDGPLAWLVSGRTAGALAAQAGRLRESAALPSDPGPPLADVAWSLATSRQAFEHRAVILGTRREELAAGLAAVAAAEPAAGVINGAAGDPGRVVFVFPGQGGQWAGMGRDLAASCPVFAEKLAECGRTLAPYTGWDLEEVLAAAALPDQANVVQPALWAVMVSLAAAWQAAGVAPDAVVGHSQGEIAAATVAGILSLEDGARIVALRSQALAVLSGRGGMVSVAEPAEAARERIAAWGDQLAVAVVNGPEATVVSGEPAALGELIAACEAAGIRARRVPVDYASHGPQVEELRERILSALAGITPGPARIPMVSAMTGQWLEGPEAGPGYWYGSLRYPVEFGRAVEVLAGAGHGVFVEVSPHPVLTAAVTGTLGEAGRAAGASGSGRAAGGSGLVVTGTLRRDDGGPARFLASLAGLHARGVPVDWAAVLPGGRRVTLPAYAFQHQRYWLTNGTGQADAAGLGQVAAGHPLLGAAVDLPANGGLVLTGRLSAAEQPWLADVTVAGRAVVPGAVLAEMALRAANATGCERVAELTTETPLVLPARGQVQVRVTVEPADTAGRRRVAIHARSADSRPDAPWTRHAAGVLAAGIIAVDPELAELDGWPPAGAAELDLTGFYPALAEAGLAYETVFRAVRTAWRRGAEVFAELSLPDGTMVAGFAVHPALLDGALQVSALMTGNGPALAAAWGDVTAGAGDALTARVRVAPGRAGRGVSVLLADAAGALVASAGSVLLRPLPGGEPGLPPQPPGLARLVPPTAGPPTAGLSLAGLSVADGGRRLAARLAALPPGRQAEAVRDLVLGQAALVLGRARLDVADAGRPFRELGFDSPTAVELRDRLVAVTGLRLPAAVVFDYPTPAALAGFVRAGLLGEVTGGLGAVARPAAVDADRLVIVGMGCRFPGGAGSAAELWDLVAAGRDAVGEFPADRGWDLEALYDPDPDGPGTSYTRWGGFLDDVAGFDAGFFGISPREALAMDPQQRLLLEVCWEALEDAGIDPAGLRGTPAGVFAGLIYHDYGLLPQEAEGYLGTGGSGGVASGRVSYALGLEGPAVTVDTACSSSLVALHLAAQSLRAGECDLALAAGVTVMATPAAFVEFSRQRGLSPDGRCKPFAEAADGTGWAEGVGVLVVERLSDARRNGHEVLAVLAGSAVNQDGASNGLTAPNGPAQQRVIRAALASAGLTADQVDVVEGHGTGTRLGDPIEAGALLATYGQGRPADRPVLLGSVKSNIGHAQAASGVAGVIKMVAAMARGVVPATLHVGAPSSRVDWDSGGLRLVTEPVSWPETDGPRRAAVSSFGSSGTNAHVILEQAPPPAGAMPAVPAVEARPVVPAASAVLVAWVLSGRSAEGLAAQAARLGRWVADRPELDLADVAWSLATTRSSFEHRAVITGGDRPELAAGLAAVAAGQPAANVVTGTTPPDGTGRVVFVFPGQGGQWAGMGRDLAASCPAFATRLAECGRALAPYTDWDLAQVLAADVLPDRADVVQPALWAVLVSLAAAWQSAGVTPDAVVGHSQGEIAAATVAGILKVEDAAKVVALRSQALTALAGRGGMISLAAPADDVRARIAPWGDRLAVAAVNGPAATVVSGEPAALDELAAACEATGIRTRRVPVDYASHGPQVESLREDILAALDGIAPGPAQVPMMSAMTGEWLQGPEADAGYWYGSLRSPVEFDRAVRALAQAGHGVFVEVSPHPVLTAAISETADAADAVDAVVTGTLRRDDGGATRFLASLAEVHVRGVPADWAAALPAGQRVALPTYAFRHQRFWPRSRSRAAGAAAAAGHPLLGAAVELAAGDGYVFTSLLSAASHPWLADHVVAGAIMLPGTAFVELAAAAGRAAGCEAVEELTLEAPLVLPSAATVRLQVAVGGADHDGRRPVQVHAQVTGPWTRHARGWLAVAGAAPPDDLTVWPPAGAEPAELGGLYAALAGTGYGYGPAFRGLRAAWRRGDEVFAEVALPEGADGSGFGVHPALLDAVLHATGLPSAAGLAGIAGPPGQVMLPFTWSGVSVRGSGPSVLRARLSPAGNAARSAGGLSLAVADETGRPVVSVASVVLRPVAAAELTALDLAGGDLAGGDGVRGALSAVEWVPVPVREAGGPVPDVVYAGAATATATATAATAGGGSGPGAVRAEVGRVLGLVQEWLAAEHLAEARLAVVTRGAVSVAGEGVADLAGAAVWGLVRSAQTENPARLVLIDLPADGGEAAEIVPASDEPELAVRDGVAYGRRLVHPSGGLTIPDGEGPWRLAAVRRGTLDGLALVPCPAAAAPLEPGQVRVAVRAAGLNFRDVVVALDLIGLDRDPGAGVMGSEVAGVVVQAGPGVTCLAPGDRVLGLAPGGLGPVAVTDARQLAPVPDGWSFARAASVPVAFATAWYALADLAGASPGQKLLVHAATGGVGMAAVTIARHLGLEVFATASPGKHAVLARMGLDRAHIASSRDAGFEAEFLAATGGAGVDIVLNALAGELTDASLRLLRGHGAFLEMGKTDIRDPGPVAADHPGVSYRAFDLGEVGPDRLSEILAEVTGLLAAGELARPPVRCWDVRRAPEALRFMSQARHTGKLVLTIPPDPAAPRAPGTVLVTGGTGLLGGLVAGHLADAGRARGLVLASRSGPAAPGVAALAAGLAGRGAAVRVVACDTADRMELAALLARVPLTGVPLTGVVHAAGVLDDGVIGSLTPARVDAVMRPKADAAWHLHELTQALDLELFVLFSSAAAELGLAGQANYAAGNAFLDGLAAARRAAGLPGVSLAWGLWAGASAMTGHLGAGDRARMTRGGMTSLSVREGLALLDAALARDEALLVPARLRVPAGPASPLWRQLGPATPETARERAAREQAPSPSAGGPARLAATVLDLVRGHAAAVIGHASADAIEPDRAFKKLGFDSLTAVELRNRLNTATGLRLPATLVFDYPTPAALAGFLRTELAGEPDQVPGPALAPRPAAAGEPVAIVGMGCRFPGGVRDPEGLWKLVAAGGDAVGAFPADRGWDLDALYSPDPDHPGTAYTRQGGFVADVAGFDAGFFGISPREALAMDPQQRLLLEVSWEALERAGVDPGSLRGSATGVFAGAFWSGYREGVADQAAEGYLLTGTATSVLSGRVAFTLGLEGPAVTVDTACSSSLVALHLACQALRSGECDLALAGGVTVMASPDGITEFSRQRGLAADGRCKAFSAAADGMGIAEGAGMLVVERLSDARRLGHEVLAVVAGTAVNQDGASNGLTAPNGPSQQRVIRAALAAAGLSAGDVDAVEAHGTGTTLGDPIEAQALNATYGQDRDRPVWLGSVKSNIGHTQAAAGAAGVIKMVLALRHGVLPPTLHADEPSPHVDWTAGKVQLLTEAVPWSAGDGRPRRAGVSSFGISGTNAHVIVTEAPAGDRDAGAAMGPALIPGTPAWLVSGRTPADLREQAARLAAHLAERPELDPVDVAWSLATTRTAFGQRAVITGTGAEELAAGLAAVAAGEPAAGVLTGAVDAAGADRVVFVFPGQGGQWAGMGRELAVSCPVFADRLAECGRALAPYLDWDLEEVLAADVLPDRADVIQPALWAVMVSLAATWQAAGVVPDAVVGHSQGEIAAAVVAGILSLADGARVVALRSKALRALAGRGGMVSVAEPAAAARARIARWGDRLSVAAVNGPGATVVCGELAALDELVAACAAAGVRARVLPVDYASHGPQVEQLRDEILAALAAVTPGPALVPMVSAMTGEWLDGPEADAGYWYDSLRSPVEFGRAVAALAADGHRVFVEVSPHPVLAAAMADDARVVAGTLRRDDGGTARFLASLASLHVLGVRVGWAAVLGGGRRTELPTYAFRPERFWPRPAPAARAPGAVALGLGAVGHPLLGAAVELAGADGLVLTGLMSVRSHPWLADHAVAGVTVLPGTAFADMAIAAANAAGCGMVDELTVQAPLTLPAERAVRVQVTVSGPAPGGRRPVEIYARPADAAGPWTRHASGWLGRDSAPADPAAELAVWPPPGAMPVATAGLYEALAADGYEYGPSFRGLRAVWRQGEDLFAEAALPTGADAAGFGVHPALLDAVLHAVGLHATGRAGDAARPGEVLLPFAWHGVSVHATGATVLRARLSRTAAGGWSLAAADSAGMPVLSAASLVLRPVATAELATVRGGVRDALFAVDWVPVPAAGGVLAGLRAAVVGEPGAGLASVAAGLAGAGAHVRGHQDLVALADWVRSGEPRPEVVLACAGTGAGTAADGGATVGGGTAAAGGATARAETGRVLELVQQWLSLDSLSSAQLVLVTQGAMAAVPGEGAADLAGAAVWGLVRSAQSENPGRLVLADLPAGTAGAQSGETYRVLAAAIGSGEPEIAIRDRVAYGRRLTRAAGGLRPPAAGPWRLEAIRPGTLDGLELAACEQAAETLRAGQVRIAVRAAGLNFRDVLISVDMYPGVAVMGSEIAGVVLETGPGVTGLAAGDRVLGLAPGGFGPLAVADARLLARVPPGWSFAQAAAVPMAFVTAWYALTDLAAARPGQKLLVQAAAGGVGTAAVTIARHLGLEVYATASPGKHGVLASMGLDRAHIASSRSAEFEPWFQAVTGEAGVDIVLNSLTADLADASLRLLPRGGTLVELGKAGLRDPVAVAAEYPGVSYRPLDLSAAGPARLGQILAQVTGLLAAGELALPPVRAWDVRRAPDGLRFMSQARHVGKLVLTIPPDPAAPREAGTVLVTGGTGMLGGLVAGHLAATGRAGALVLASRSGPAASQVAELAAELAGKGASVQVTACDVADRAALAALLARIPATWPLTAVMHAAGVLDDGVTESLTPARVEAVLRPKADAAWHLHELTASLDLQAFVLFSSVAATVGAAGQGSYVAANTFLDALASHRRAAGLPALSLAWGAWVHRAGIGRNLGENQLSRISRSGMAELSAEEGLALLDAALNRDEALLVPARIDLAGLRLRGASVHPLWRGLVPEIPALPEVPEAGLAPENPWTGGLHRHAAAGGLDRHAAGTGAEGLRRQLAAMPGPDRHKLLVDLVRAHAAAVIGHATADPVEPDRPFRELGFDSLTAVELRNRLNAATGLQLPATLIFDYPTPAELGGYLRARTADQEPEGPPALAELDRLEAALSRLAVSGDERSRILTRLEALVQDVRAGTTDNVSAYRDLDEATDEEMFDLIDEELGI